MTSSPKRHFDELTEGETLTCPPFRFTEEQIIRFCREYDPQFFHTDPERAKHSSFGGLIASGWQTAAMVLNILTTRHFHFPDGIIGLGLDKLRWRAPVRAGDDLSVEVLIAEKRPSASRPGWGVAVLDIRVRNQQGEAVLDFLTSILIRR